MIYLEGKSQMSNGDDLLTGTDIDFTVSEESIENVHNLETVSD